MHRIFFVLLSITLFNYVNGLSTKFVTAKNLEKIRLDKEGFEKAQLIHYNWYLHSIKAIMGQMGKDLLPSLSPSTHFFLLSTFNSFLHCLDVIVDKRDVVTAAKCLIEAKSKSLVLKSNEFLTQRIPLHGNLEMSTSGPRKENKFENPFVQEFRPVNATMQTIMWKNKIGKGRKIIKPEKNSIRHLITNKFSIKSHLLDKFKSYFKLLESTGMSKSDRESVLEMVMEVSGATQTIGDAIKTY
uniref:Uncharacterized protein n=1 Tax=Heterorhabditis bacteriophora TaxID=37862 RepID=A0A1I7WRI2_HETBA